jgi:PRTRC genetic system ThiF family protein
MRIEHTLPSDLLGQKPVRVLVVGAGGTGSAIVMGLPYLDQAMRVWGRSSGLEVVMMDADTVSETNCVRQPFSVSDIGQNKATVLINRINLFWGTRWRAEPTYFDEQTFDRINDRSIDLLIGCVDTRAARSVIARALTKARNRTAYWLDLGNNAASGQFVLGQPLNARNRRKAARLRTVSELYPEIIDAEAGEDPLPSCSAVEALDRQEPFINQTLGVECIWRCWRGSFATEFAYASWSLLQCGDGANDGAANRPKNVVAVAAAQPQLQSGIERNRRSDPPIEGLPHFAELWNSRSLTQVCSAK